MKEYIGLDSNIDYMTETDLKNRYGFTKDFLRMYFPKPIVLKCVDPAKRDLIVWKTRDVEHILLDKNLHNAYESINVAEDFETKGVREYLKSYDLNELSQTASNRNRYFILHVGPTNSGKTYNALQALKRANNGVYLGPLRLLAHDIFDTLNRDGYPCSLLTGQEYEDVPFSKLISSTIELCNYNEHYDVAVIDEAQLIADSVRGGCWTKTIFQINADEVHVCLAPEALELIIDMIRLMGCQYKIDRCERKTPLVFSGVFKDLTCVKSGDALIAFSKKSVLAIVAALEENGIKSRVLYGSLPPKARRSEVGKFTDGMTQVVVATDAIGMGVSLPIKRVVFCETQKFDGKKFRHLRNHEIKQIAGRAGRFGKYPIGEVLTMTDLDDIQDALNTPCRNIEKFTMPFPTEAFGYSKNIELVLSEWERLFPSEMYRRKSMEIELNLFRRLKKEYVCDINNETVFKLISSPFDTNDSELLSYWLNCCRATLLGSKLPYPAIDITTLEGCELQYKALDLRDHISRRFGEKTDSFTEKDKLCDAINKFLLSDKDKYLSKCRQCGKRLDFSQKVGLCDKCYETLADERSKFRQERRKEKQKKKNSYYSYLK